MVGRVTRPAAALPTVWRVRVINSSWLLPLIIYNFQRWMSRLEQRWRAQRSAISIVNCRIPWIDRNLNAYCVFGISLKACLLQCLHVVIPAVLVIFQLLWAFVLQDSPVYFGVVGVLEALEIQDVFALPTYWVLYVQLVVFCVNGSCCSLLWY